jgi:hypothetical protein
MDTRDGLGCGISQHVVDIRLVHPKAFIIQFVKVTQTFPSKFFHFHRQSSARPEPFFTSLTSMPLHFMYAKSKIDFVICQVDGEAQLRMA